MPKKITVSMQAESFKTPHGLDRCHAVRGNEPGVGWTHYCKRPTEHAGGHGWVLTDAAKNAGYVETAAGELANKDYRDAVVAGMTFQGSYKGSTHTLFAIQEGSKVKFVMDNRGPSYPSLSAAGKAATGAASCNGWVFWKVVTHATEAVLEPEPVAEPEPATV